MANSEHLRILHQGVQPWNEWRGKNPSEMPHLIGAGLSGADLIGADLSGANLSGADLSGAHLNVANLSGVTA